MNYNAITIKTSVNAPIDIVWKHLTDPSSITKWNAASADWHTTEASSDLRTGGKLSCRMEAKDGSAGFDFNATYSRITPPTELHYTLDDGRSVSTTLSHEGGSTLITQTFDPESENPIEMQRQGWQAILNNFKLFVEQQPTNVKLNFSEIINAPASEVYDIMLSKFGYRQWASVFNPSSRYEGSWDKGSEIKFLGTNEEGTDEGMKGIITENIPGRHVSIQYTGYVGMVGVHDNEGWKDTVETYHFKQKNGDTVLSVELIMPAEYADYFVKTYPKALKTLKDLIENTKDDETR